MPPRSSVPAVVLVAVLCVLAALSAPPASGACSVPKLFGSFDPATGETSYLLFSPDATETSVLTRFWQDGSTGTGSTRSFGESSWLLSYFPAGPGVFYLNGDASLVDAGCPRDALLTLAENDRGEEGGEFVLLRALENPAAAMAFNYQPVGRRFHAAAIPSPIVHGVTERGTTKVLRVSLPPVRAGVYGPAAAAEVSGYQLLAVPADADPGSRRAAYTATLGTASRGGLLGEVELDCSDPETIYYLAVGLSFDGDRVSSTLVSDAEAVACTPEVGLRTLDGRARRGHEGAPR